MGRRPQVAVHRGGRLRPATRDLRPLLAIVALFIALRAALFVDPALHLGWNSDAAIFGLMAKAIAAGRELPLFFWRQSYMGVMTSYLAAPLMHAMNGALALRIASTIEVLAGILFYWLALRVGSPPSAAKANVVALWLAIGPAYLMQFSIAPIGGEQMFVLSAIIFWFAVRTGLARDRHWFILGLLAGFGWWIHQGIAFALAAAVIAAILRSEWWRNVRAIPMRRPPLVAIILAALIAIDLILGAIVSLGYEAPAFFLFDPVMEPLVALLILIAVTVILSRADGEGPLAFLPTGPSRSAALRMTAGRAVLFAIGALIAYSPVIIGTMRGLVPDTYGLSVPAMPLRGVVEHIVTFVSSDLWLFIGAAASIVIAPFFIAAMLRRPRLDMPLITIILCTIFYLFSQRAHPGTMRYIVSALPMVYAF